MFNVTLPKIVAIKIRELRAIDGELSIIAELAWRVSDLFNTFTVPVSKIAMAEVDEFALADSLKKLLNVTVLFEQDKDTFRIIQLEASDKVERKKVIALLSNHEFLMEDLSRITLPKMRDFTYVVGEDMPIYENASRMLTLLGYSGYSKGLTFLIYGKYVIDVQFDEAVAKSQQFEDFLQSQNRTEAI